MPNGRPFKALKLHLIRGFSGRSTPPGARKAPLAGHLFKACRVFLVLDTACESK